MTVFPRFAANDSVQLQLSVQTCSNDGVALHCTVKERAILNHKNDLHEYGA